jgi:hypothetical protein
MDNYTPDELHDYAIQRYVGKLNAQELDIIMDLCENPFEVQMICDYGVIEFWEYVLKVVDNVHLVSGSNSFKIGDRIAFKEDEKGKINLKLFWKAFMTVCANRLTEDPLKYSQGVKITSKYLQELRIVGINRVSTFDMWLLEIREYWMED